MTIYPNNDCAAFCYWMLNVSWQKLSNPRLALINTIYNAAISGSSVTQTEFNNFTQVTAWRYKYYLIYLNNSAKISSTPVGTLDFWMSAAGLRYSTTNTFGTVSTKGLITSLYDINGGSVSGAPPSAATSPSLSIKGLNTISPNVISFNDAALQCFNLSNAAGLTNNITGYTIFAICTGNTSGTSQAIMFFSTGTSAVGHRLSLRTNSSGAFLAAATRLDAGPSGSITAGSALTGIQIIAFAVDYTNGQAFLYSNGQLIGQNLSMFAGGNTSATNSLNVQIGGINSVQTTNGIGSDYLAYNSFLSSTDILQISDWLNSFRAIY